MVSKTLLDTIFPSVIVENFDNRSTNALAESFNAKVKAFRSQFRGVRDILFFIFRLAKIFASSRAPQLANTQASCSKQAAQATPKGLLRLLCAGIAENANQPTFFVEPSKSLKVSVLPIMPAHFGTQAFIGSC